MIKNHYKKLISLFALCIFFVGCKMHSSYIANPHIVFIAADDEYRSEESMPMLGEIMKREIGAKISMCFATDADGYINPSAKKNITNLSALKSADLVVFFMRFRALPDEQLKLITDYVESGKPIVGFRTSTHAFLYDNNENLAYYNKEWSAKVFGQHWIVHHGHFDDGQYPLTEVFPTDPNHIILTGVRPFKAYSWLYHVDGGDWKLQEDCKPFVYGKSLKSEHQLKGNLHKYPLENPVAWTKTYKGARVFFTTLGHPFDFKDENMRRLSINGILWALKRENNIKPNLNVRPSKTYSPNNSGMGEPYNKFVKPYTTL